MEIRWARSATKHRISRQRSGYVAQTAKTILTISAPANSKATDDRLVFLGIDEDGIALEVMAVQTEQGILIIHAMPIRDRYRNLMQH